MNSLAAPSLAALVTGLDARKSGAGWKALCPAHADRNPSLTITERDGHVLFKCWAGCPQDAVLDALRGRGLWPERQASSTGTLNGHVPAAPRALETRFEYYDDAGALVALHKRVDLPGGDKRMAWLLADGTPSRDGQVKAEHLPLYRLADLLKAPADSWVLVVEGEKAADAAQARGFVAVSLAGGASQPRFGAALDRLRGRRVALWPDHDDAGRGLMRRVFAALRDKAGEVRWLEVPNLPEKGDAADFFGGGRTADELRQVIEMARPASAAAAPPVATFSAADLLAREFAPAREIVERVFYEGLMIVGGRPKLGKSWLMLSASLAVAAGGRALGHLAVDGGDVLYLALEDGPKRLQSRLRSLLGEQPAPARLTLATEWRRFDEGGLDDLDLWLAGHEQASLVVMDTLKRVRPRERPGASVYGQDYDALAPLADLAKRRGVCVAVVHHTRKGEADDPLELISGSFGLSGAADGAAVLKRTRGSGDATLAVLHRDAEDCELALRWDTVTGCWIVLGDAAEVQRSTQRNEVLRLLHDVGASYPKDIADALGRPGGATRVLLFQMVRAGEVRAEGGRYSAVAPRPADADSAPTGNTTNTANALTLPDGEGVLGVSGAESAANAQVDTPPRDTVSGVRGPAGAANVQVARLPGEQGPSVSALGVLAPVGTTACTHCPRLAVGAWAGVPLCHTHHPLHGRPSAPAEAVN